jgi:glycine betaine catabolism B
MTFTGTLIERLERTTDSASFRFTRPPEYSFEAGQSYSITIPSSEGPQQHRFSHADSPTEGFTELTTRLTGPPFKNALDALPVGGRATFRGPAGLFVFRYQEPRAVFLVGGIGITPVRSMLRYLVDTHGVGRVPGQRLVLLYACTTEEGVVYRSELDSFARAISGLRVEYVLSRPHETWPGRRGFIDATVLNEELGEPSQWAFYIVGPPPMVTAMDQLMAEFEIPENQIVKENFAGYTS